MRRFGRRSFMLAVSLTIPILSAQVAACPPRAYAATDTQAQNPDLTVSLSVPDEARIGDTIDATVSISNTSPKIQTITVRGIWTDPAGEATVQTRSGLLFPGQTVSRVITYAIDESCIVGIHEITVAVEARSGTSSASSTVEIDG
ncbi:MAG: hypothetical protein IT305_24740 [Chloroflexi bacterium]|nr:hypothetical protein [Chloroflexota bacterium]